MPHVLRRELLFVLGLALAACSTEPAPTPAPPPAPPTNMSARERAASEVHVDPSAAADAISHYREEHGLSAVTPDPVLQKLAQAQADAMALHNVLSHTIAGTLTQRFDAADLADATAVENVSAGYFSLPAALAGWQNSPPHNANLLSPKMRRLGIATAYAPGTRYLVFWALDMSD
ncbi:MAG TPA: CAP domain-containing protein [Methylovirgula sp.]|nr:CAP domain-containing protein [Methylovirgula sp.]